MEKTSRREFIRTSSLAGLGRTLASNSIGIFANGSPNKKLVVAMIGVNGRGGWLAKIVAKLPDVEIAYVCDVDETVMNKCITTVTDIQKVKPKGEKDLRKVLEDKSVDAVVIATPDHWHAPAAILACAAGKHVYVEKPISHNPNEGELVIQASKKYNRIVQMGNQRRSWPNILQCINELHNGIIGNVYFAKGWYTNGRNTIGIGKTAPVPANLDYELWQGPAPRKEYKDNLIHYNWHWFWNWGTGEALNNGTHEIDLIRWGLGADYPIRISSLGGRYHFKDDWQTPDTQVINADFENGKSFTWESRSCNSYNVEGAGRGVIFYGDKGTVVTKGGNAYTVYDPSNKVVKEITEQNNTEKTNTISPGGEFLDAIHLNNFFEAIRGNTIQNSPAEEGFKSVLICQLGNISFRTKKLLNIDSLNGHILNDDEALKLWKPLNLAFFP